MKDGEEKTTQQENSEDPDLQAPDILEEIETEDFAVDGICGVY